ncbi:YecH family metal-binding protein [Orbus mooreae]|uniref:YecH family metal-binding protein n=1 Tax=Orbus mooreae TaxID=3074107 RepID=UPI00370D0AF4
MGSIHGHEVLDMMKNHHYTEESLLVAINQKFGENATFHTCSKQGMTAQELIKFLAHKGKFKSAESSEFTVDVTKICHH